MRGLIAALLLSLTLAGCAAPAQAPAAAEEPPSPVYADWSKLTPYEPPREVFSYHAGYRADGVFAPRGDYGVLLPYAGKYAAMEQYVIDALPLYGLVTDRGELVSEPVYTTIDCRDGFLLLCRGRPDGKLSRTLAAADGRWARDLADGHRVASGSGRFLTAAADRSLTVWNTDGEVVTRFDGALFTPFLGADFFWDEEDGPFVHLADDRVGYLVSYLVDGVYLNDGVQLYLDLDEGTVTTEPPAGYAREFDYSLYEQELPAPPEVEGCSYLDPIVDPIAGKTYFFGHCCFEDSDVWHDVLFDGAGRPLFELDGLSRFDLYAVVRAGLCSTVEDNCFCYRSVEDKSLVFRRVLRSNTD